MLRCGALVQINGMNKGNTITVHSCPKCAPVWRATRSAADTGKKVRTFTDYNLH